MAAITITAINPATQGLNKWIRGNSWNIAQGIYNDLVTMNNSVPALAAANNVFTGQLTTGAGIVQKHTGVAIATTAAGTLAVVTQGVVAGLITSTSAAAVLLTLDSAAVMLAALGAAAGSYCEFIIDNAAGANTITLAVDSGATVAVTTPAITGGATLTVSAVNAVAKFGIYFPTAATAKLFRIF